MGTWRTERVDREEDILVRVRVVQARYQPERGTRLCDRMRSVTSDDIPRDE